VRLEFGFEEKRLERIAAAADPKNIASWKAMERAGMIREGLLRHTWKYQDVWHDEVLYGVIRSEFLAEGCRGAIRFYYQSR